jgi:hypothetical protein
LPDERVERRTPESFHEQPLRDRGQRHERRVGAERPVGGEHVHMGIEVRQIPEGLHEQDEPRPGPGEGRGVGINEQPGDEPAELAEPRPMLAEARALEPRDGEPVLAVRDGLEDVTFDPLAV